MEIRRLNDSEYPLLELHEDAKKVISPENSVAVGAFDNGRLVGQMILVSMGHLEGTHIIPEKRGGLLFRQLEKKMQQVAKEEGITTLLGYTGDDQIVGYMERMGWKRLPITVVAKEL